MRQLIVSNRSRQRDRISEIDRLIRAGVDNRRQVEGNNYLARIGRRTIVRCQNQNISAGLAGSDGGICRRCVAKGDSARPGGLRPLR